MVRLVHTCTTTRVTFYCRKVITITLTNEEWRSSFSAEDAELCMIVLLVMAASSSATGV